MKNLKLSFLFILLTVSSLQAQWQEQLDIGLFTHLDRIHFIDENYGWAIGSFWYSEGPYFFTTDGGEDWYTSGPYGYDIFFVNHNTGFIAAQNGIIYKTTDGGLNWSTVSTATTQNIVKLFFVDENNGWVTLSSYIGDGKMLHTTDGGNTWELQQVFVEEEGFVDSVFFIDNSTGWACGTYHDPTSGDVYSSIVKTEDSGQTWVKKFTSSSYWMFNDMFFIDSFNGWVVGGQDSPLLMHTSDGGNTWDWESLPDLIDNYGVLVEARTIYSIQFINETDGWLTCQDGYQNGYILFTTDAGETWQQQYFNNTNLFYDISIIDENHGWTVGAGQILFNSDIYHIPVSIDEYQTQTFKITPNPFDTTIRIENTNNTLIDSLTITDSVGRICYQLDDITPNQIDLSYLKTGVYFITIQTKQNYTLTHKIIKL